VVKTDPGTYGSVASGALFQSDTYFTAGSTGTVTVVAGYAAWATLYAGGPTAPADGDYNNDGVENGVAYFMGMNGLATHPGVVGNTVTWPYLNSVASYKVQTSADLSPAGWTDVLPGDSRLHVTAPGPSGAVSYDLLPPAEGRLFVRLLITP
jgi:hypothetical protein